MYGAEVGHGDEGRVWSIGGNGDEGYWGRSRAWG